MRDRRRKYAYIVSFKGRGAMTVIASTRLSAAHKAARIFHCPCVINRATMFVKDCVVRCVREVSRAEYLEVKALTA